MQQTLINVLSHIRPYIRVENIFLFIFLPFAILFAVITPVGQNPDENSHFLRSWQLAEFNLLSETVYENGEKNIGGHLPSSFGSFFGKNGVEGRFDKGYKFNQIDRDAVLGIHIGTLDNFYDFRGAALYSPAAYLPTVPAVWLGKLFDLSLGPIYYLARVFCIFTLAALLYIAIRIIPIGKWVIFTVGLLPSTVSQAAALSADSITIGVGIVFIAFTLSMAFRKSRLSWRHFTLLGILILSIGLIKITYLPMTLLVILIPLLNRSTRRLKQYTVAILVICAAVIPSIAWMVATKYIDNNYGNGSNINEQLSFIISSPFLYIKTIFYTFFTSQDSNSTLLIWHSFIGNFGYLTAPLPGFFILTATTAIVLSAHTRSSRESAMRISRKTLTVARIIILATFSVTALSIATALYLYFSTLKASTISGIQGRYFLPIAPLALLCLYGVNTMSNQKKAKVAIIILVILTLIGAVFTAYSRYYRTVPPILT